jgi:hypothetical protein
MTIVRDSPVRSLRYRQAMTILLARHLRGCYLTRDSVYSQAALLRRGSKRKVTS